MKANGRFGTFAPPEPPRVLVADLAGAERAVSAALSLLLARERGQGAGYEQVALSEAAWSFAEPLRQGLAAPGGVLGGGYPGYGLYRTRDGYVALAALDPHFWERLLQELGVKGDERRDLERIFEDCQTVGGVGGRTRPPARCGEGRRAG